MQYRPLINSEIELSEIGLGCASYWGKKSFSENQAIDIVHQAIDSGVNYFDTGHSYSGGHAEIRLGKALKGRKELIVSSKAGTRIGSFGRLYKDFSPQWIRDSIEQSLRNLHSEQLPIFFLHGPNPEDFNDELFSELERQHEQGNIGLIGVNAFSDPILDLCLSEPCVQAVMLDFNLYKPQRIDLIKKMTHSGKDVFVAGALAGAVYDSRLWRFQGMKSIWYWLRAWKNNPQLKSMIKHMKFLNDLPNVSAAQAALAYVLKDENVKSALVGTTKVKHLKELLMATEINLDQSIIRQIESQAQKYLSK